MVAEQKSGWLEIGELEGNNIWPRVSMQLLGEKNQSKHLNSGP
jgi:hypothetical protein